MARSKFNSATDDLITDGGGVLWSFIKGEQLEFPITLNFITDASLAYTFEAVLLEALNVDGQTEAPSTIKLNGVQTPLTVVRPRTPTNWVSTNTYNYDDVVLYNGLYYKFLLLSGNETPSAISTKWLNINLNDISIRFPSTISTGWEKSPTVDSPVYGFFELRVTEPANPSNFVRTWKPVRGTVELLYSLTDLVPDV
jgi:hypothetical protein